MVIVSYFEVLFVSILGVKPLNISYINFPKDEVMVMVMVMVMVIVMVMMVIVMVMVMVMVMYCGCI